MTKSTLRAVAAAALVIIGATPVAAQQSGEAQAVSFTDTVSNPQMLALIDQGLKLFNTGTCTVCHAVGARGDGQRGPNLTDEEWLHSEGDFEGVMETIGWGVKLSEVKAVSPRPFQMNPDGGMTIRSAERRALAAYVWSLSNGPVTDAVNIQNELLAMLDSEDGRHAADLLRTDIREHPDSPMLAERAVNALGYEYLLRWESPETAIELFLFNTETHPESWNTWDSLGEGYAALGETEKAIESYQKSLDLNPQNTAGTEALERLRSQ